VASLRADGRQQLRIRRHGCHWRADVAAGWRMLLGRRSYDDMLGTWNKRGGPFKDSLNAATKYVASSDLDTKLTWPTSTLLSGDVPGRVAKLKREEGGNLVIMGSGKLIRSLIPHALVDEFLLIIIHPIVLGSGRRLFEHVNQRTSHP
jgi:dihydrofolate reductase